MVQLWKRPVARVAAKPNVVRVVTSVTRHSSVTILRHIVDVLVVADIANQASHVLSSTTLAAGVVVVLFAHVFDAATGTKVAEAVEDVVA